MIPVCRSSWMFVAGMSECRNVVVVNAHGVSAAWNSAFRSRAAAGVAVQHLQGGCVRSGEVESPTARGLIHNFTTSFGNQAVCSRSDTGGRKNRIDTVMFPAEFVTWGLQEQMVPPAICRSRVLREQLLPEPPREVRATAERDWCR